MNFKANIAESILVGQSGHWILHRLKGIKELWKYTSRHERGRVLEIKLCKIEECVINIRWDC